MYLHEVVLLCFSGCLLTVGADLIKLSCKELRQLVDGHNERRLLLAKGMVRGQPPAAEMRAIIWDKELATKAAGWAILAKDLHNPDKKIPSGRFLVGENLYWFKTTDPNKTLNMDFPLRSWWKEYEAYKFTSYRQNNVHKLKKFTHYTQMAWSNSTHLGCAVNRSKKDRFHTHFVVCNYGPAGNIIGQAPYKSGIPSKRLSCVPKSKCYQKYGPDCG